MKIWPQRINQSGDTIVEVLIAVAVVSSVLLGAYLVAQKSTTAVRDSQEHSEMLQILQGQVELVRSLALDTTTDDSGVFATPPTAAKYFCIDATTQQIVAFSPISYTLPALNADTFAYPAACKNLNTRYNVAVTYDESNDVFTFTGRWYSLEGGKDQEQLTYRVYPGDSSEM
jgi:type II secretory pathway pseudopilin PulG